MNMFETCFYDNHYRIISASSTSIKIFSIEKNSEENKLVQVYEISLAQDSTPNFIKTRGGRRIKNVNYSEIEEIIHSWCYDDETDLLAVLMKGCVNIYENIDGTLVKQMKLKNYREDWKNTIILDKYILVHLSSDPGSSKTECSVYQIGETE